MSFISGQVSQRPPEPFCVPFSVAILADRLNRSSRVPLFTDR